MLLLLPPSEGKTPAPDGAAPLDLAALSGSDALTAQRQAVLAALAEVSASDDAHDVLGVGASLAAEVERNTRLHAEPADAAARVYTGVLYAAAGLADLEGTPARRAADSVRILSGLWGAVSPADRIPAYRLSMGVDLPGVGRLATAWRGPLGAALDARAAGDVVVDCRSATYVAAWKPRPGAAEWVTVRVVREVRGKRAVVSHNAKHTRGVLTGHLLRRDAAPSSAGGTRPRSASWTCPRSASELLDAAGELVGTVVGTEVGSGLSYTLRDATLEPARTRTSPATLELLIS
ncbi:YaaA family protein [Xylanimonas protaetiae]|uniref:Peroxide stress protein YaaA n=1 Tax=Xylanimonas protaetiae TaxID=2509457 RepID=A0A4P6FCS7_9MICO|nr:peroxide stress protein YaaA [Xylanimonas protaetiae]QAY71357.1 peroxide stress protein YaaA [Xylanimonas protaetiae]